MISGLSWIGILVGCLVMFDEMVVGVCEGKVCCCLFCVSFC